MGGTKFIVSGQFCQGIVECVKPTSLYTARFCSIFEFHKFSRVIFNLYIYIFKGTDTAVEIFLSDPLSCLYAKGDSQELIRLA